jgi:hydrogenase maturation protease
MSRRVLVAGIGNVLFGDGAFGVAVAQRLRGQPLPSGVEILDVGNRALHLAFALLDPPSALIVVDTVRRGDRPGTVSILEPSSRAYTEARPTVPDGCGMSLQSVFGALESLGGAPPPTLVVGCEAASVDEGWGLSPEVQAALPEAVRVVLRLARHEVEGATPEGATEVRP